jgi:hypothetical protein
MPFRVAHRHGRALARHFSAWSTTWRVLSVRGMKILAVPLQARVHHPRV